MRIKAVFAMAVVALSAFIPVQAATWYVDGTAAGAKNGTSWANAWASFSQMSGMAAGDVVYISGGPSGGTQTYTLASTWVPKSGAAGKPITYQIGQDPQHNGTAIFNVSGSGDWVGGPPNYVVISGDAGDGKMHFKLGSVNRPIDGASSTGIRFSYVDCGNRKSTFRFNDATQVELDHCYLYKTDGGDDYAVSFVSVQGSTWDVNKIHHNTFYVPRSGCGDGDDGVQGMGNGVSIYNNILISYSTTYTGNQHGDGLQPTSGSYLKIYNNYFADWANYAIFCDSYFGDFTHVWIYNNIAAITDPALQNCAAIRGIVIVPDGGVFSNIGRWPVFSDIVVANNLITDFGAHGSIELQNQNSSQSSTFTQCTMANNIVINGTGVSAESSVTKSANVLLSGLTNSGGHFVSYSPFKTNNDFHLVGSDTTFRGKGTALQNYFTVDKDGLLRPTAGWDIGPYQFSGAASTNPIIAVIPGFLDFGSIPVNTTVDKSFTVQNVGGGTLSGSTTVSAPFSVISGGTYNLASNQTQVVTVRYSPTTQASDSRVIAFSGGGGTTANCSGSAYSGQPGLTFASTAGTITAPFAAGPGYISQDVQTDLVSGGRAVYGFSITTAGDYTIDMDVNAPSDAENSLFINIDSDPTDPTMIWDMPVTAGVERHTVSWRGNGTSDLNEFVPKVFSLSTGQHSLVIVGREANVQLGTIQIVSEGVPPNPPVGLRIVAQ